MFSIRRVGGLAVAGLLMSSFVGGPATAQEQVVTSPEAYAGAANAQALILTLAGSGVTAGLSKASGDSTAKAVAEGQGSLLLGSATPLPFGATKPSTATQVGDGKVVGKKECATDPTAATPLAALLTVGVACGTSTAEVVGGKPNGLATGSVFDLDVTANSVLSAVPISALSPVLTPVLGGIDTINKTVAGLPAVGGVVGDLKVDDTVTQLLANLQSVKTLEVRLGSSQSQVVAVDGTVTALATAEGGIISILPVNLPLVDGTVVTKPLVEILVGSAKSKAVYDRATGKATPTFDPAIVTIRVNNPITDAVSGKVAGINFQEIQIDPNLIPSVLPAAIPAAVVAKCADAENEFCILAGTPLETRVAVSSGRVRTNSDGSVTAISDAVKIHALKNLPAPLAGGLLLELARAEATVGGRPAVIDTPRASLAPPEIPAELPRTGGTPWMPVVGLVGLALVVVTRRALVRSN